MQIRHGDKFILKSILLPKAMSYKFQYKFNQMEYTGFWTLQPLCKFINTLCVSLLVAHIRHTMPRRSTIQRCRTDQSLAITHTHTHMHSLCERLWKICWSRIHKCAFRSIFFYLLAADIDSILILVADVFLWPTYILSLKLPYVRINVCVALRWQHRR